MRESKHKEQKILAKDTQLKSDRPKIQYRQFHSKAVLLTIILLLFFTSKEHLYAP